MPGTPLEITGALCSLLRPVEGIFVGIFLKETAAKCFYCLQQHNVCWSRWQCELICDRRFLPFSWGHGFALYELKNREKEDYLLKVTFPSPAAWSQFSLSFYVFLKHPAPGGTWIQSTESSSHSGTTQPCAKLTWAEWTRCSSIRGDESRDRKGEWRECGGFIMSVCWYSMFLTKFFAKVNSVCCLEETQRHKMIFPKALPMLETKQTGSLRPEGFLFRLSQRKGWITEANRNVYMAVI